MFLAHGPPAIPTKVSQLLVLAIVVGLFVHTKRLHQWHAYEANAVRIHHEVIATEGPTPEEQYLLRLKKEYGLTNETTWTAWRVRPSDRASEGVSVTEIEARLGSNRRYIIDTEKPNRAHLRAWRELSVPVPQSPLPTQVDVSDFLFGISTTYDRVSAHNYAIVRDWSRWLTGGSRQGNGASFVLVLDQANDDQVLEIDEVLEKHGIDAHITTSLWPMSSARRYFELVRIMKMFAAKLATNGLEKKWFGLLDDHIFLPNLSYLQDRLYAYNSDQELYIGLPSERLDWEFGNGAMTTSGGGAVFLTRSAVMRIPDLPCFGGGDMKSAFRAKKWDGLLQDCVMEHTDLTMRVLPSFYSPSDNDEYAKRADSYETGIQPLTLHHYEERHLLNPSMAHLVTNVCGEACFLQRYRFRDNWIMVNGYSITEYPDGFSLGDVKPDSSALPGRARQKRLSVVPRVLVDEDAIERKMLTWRGRRNVWRLMDSAVGKNGAVWQAYVKKGGDFDDATTHEAADADWRDSVMVMMWENGDSTTV